MPGRPATLRDVAAAAGVHPATASRALNPETQLLVSDDTARRVTDAAARLGYRPNPVARSLRTRRSFSVGVLIPDLNNPLFPPMVRGLEDRLATQGYVALLGNTDADDTRERMVFDQMRARHVDGYVLATAFPSVSVDNEQGARAAVTHLARLGHTRIACIAGPQDTSTGLARLRGYHEGLSTNGLTADESLITYADAYSVQEGLRCCQELLARGAGFTAIAAANDMVAIGCYAAFDAAGLRCPEDISVIGFNDMPFVDRLHPPLSTIRFPHYQLGTEAAQLLLERISGTDKPVKILFLAPELVVRGSTSPPQTPAS
jgi:LacI family transcriptional regulator